jgi:hypothetical protein
VAHSNYRRHLLLVALSSILMLVGCGGEKDTLSAKSGSLTAQLSSNPTPPASGHDSSFTVALTDNGQPLTGAQVRMEFFFLGLNQEGPKLPATESAPGQYTANEVSIGMGGKWKVDVFVTRAGSSELKLTIPFHASKGSES